MVAYRRGKNLADQLIRAKVSTKRRSSRLKNGFGPCKQGCRVCWHCKTTSVHVDKRTGRTWKIRAPINCLTKNVVYQLLCKQCPLFHYEGETLRELRQRILDHLSYVRNKKENQVAGHHFNLPGHSIADLEVVGIERVLPRKNDIIRKSRESYWINEYESTVFGFNRRN